MKRLLFLLVFITAINTSHAQVKLEDIVKPGTRLVYTVTSDNTTYDFVVTIKDRKGTSFDWEMGSPADQKGTVIHTPKALKDGYKMFNYFHSETKKLDDLTLSVWLSQKVFNELVKNTGSVKVGMYDPTDEPLNMKISGDGEFVIRIDGKAEKIHDKMVRATKKGKTEWLVDKSIDDYFTFYNSASFPIILRMRDKFYLTLKEIKTK